MSLTSSIFGNNDGDGDEDTNSLFSHSIPSQTTEKLSRGGPLPRKRKPSSLSTRIAGTLSAVSAGLPPGCHDDADAVRRTIEKRTRSSKEPSESRQCCASPLHTAPTLLVATSHR